MEGCSFYACAAFALQNIPYTATTAVTATTAITKNNNSNSYREQKTKTKNKIKYINNPHQTGAAHRSFLTKFRFIKLFQISTAPVILRSEATKDPHLVEHPQYRRGFFAPLRMTVEGRYCSINRNLIDYEKFSIPNFQLKKRVPWHSLLMWLSSLPAGPRWDEW